MEGLTFLKVRTCAHCGHSSNEPNPITLDTEGLRGPCWPWREGDYTNPSGWRCKLCPIAHRLGAFPEGMTELAEKMKSCQATTSEFLACVKELVRLVNAGEFTLNMKMRAGSMNKAKFHDIFKNVRKTTVDVVKQSGLRVKTPYRARLLSKWEQENPGKDAAAEGHQVRWVPTPDKGMQKCIMLRTGGVYRQTPRASGCLCEPPEPRGLHEPLA